MRGIWRRARGLIVGGGIVTVALAAAPAAHGESAVLLVSGFDTSTPFTTPDPSCAGKEGPTWSNPQGPAAALRAAGSSVFTAPVAQGGALPPTPCLGPGQPAPPGEATIDSNGELDANGRALETLLGFLRTDYGVDSVQLVGHSDGGLWSRSAITQLAGNSTIPTVQSLTTLGTPHTGSFGADLAETLQNGRCREANRVERLICEAVLGILKDVFGSLGKETIKELTHSFLAGWNPRQAIGCPVTVIGGTAVDIPLVPSFLDYYDPSDGIVGEASALAERSTSITLKPIPAPGFRAIGKRTFPVVHSSVLTFITPRTLLNQADISAAVVAAVRAGTSRPPCASAGTEAAPTEAAPTRTRVGFHSIDVPRRGWLPRPRRGDAVLLTRRKGLRCRGGAIGSVPVLGSRRLNVALPRCRTRLRVVGRGRALALRSHPRRGLVVRRGQRRIQVRTTGQRLRQVRARVLLRGRWRRLPLARGRRLPETRRGRGVSVRVVGRNARGERLAATGHVAPPTAG